MNDSRTVSISIERTFSEVYDYLVQPERFPEWSLFIREMRAHGADWIAITPHGEVSIHFVSKNPYGVLDHTVTVSPKIKVFVPFRVVPNDIEGSEVLFTVFRQPGMTDDAFEHDLAMTRADLASLKAHLEKIREFPSV